MKTLCSLLVLGFVLFIGSLAVQMNAPNFFATSVQAHPQDAARLTVLAQHFHRVSEHYAQFDGQVKNPTPVPLSNVKAIISYYDKHGTFLTSDGALITYNPLLPGQTSPFQVLTPWHPWMAKAALSFTTLWGQPIPAEEKAAPTPQHHTKKTTKR